MRQRVLGVMALVAALCGCASTPPAGPVHRGEPVALTLVPYTSTEPIAISNGAMGSGLGRGATAGGVAGGLAGLACGPFAILCVPIGAGIGALTGTATGAVVGATGALSSENAAQARARWEQARQAHDMVEDLRAQIVAQAAKPWRLGTEPAAAVALTIELKKVQLTSTRDDQVGLYVQVLATARRAGDAPTAEPFQRYFEFEAEPIRLATWLDPNGDYVEGVLRNCAQQLASRIVADLTHE